MASGQSSAPLQSQTPRFAQLEQAMTAQREEKEKKKERNKRKRKKKFVHKCLLEKLSSQCMQRPHEIKLAATKENIKYKRTHLGVVPAEGLGGQNEPLL